MCLAALSGGFSLKLYLEASQEESQEASQVSVRVLRGLWRDVRRLSREYVKEGHQAARVLKFRSTIVP